MDTRDVRTRSLRYSDPLMVVVGAAMTVAASIGVFARLGLSVEQIVAIENAILVAAAATRAWLEHRNERRVATMSEQREQRAHRIGLLKPQPRMRRYKGSEGGEVELEIDPADEPTPVEGPREDRRG